MIKKICITVLLGAFLIASNSFADSIQIGNNYSLIYSVLDGKKTIEGGGSIDVSYLNGNKLEYLYCVDLFKVIYPNNTYDQTVVTNDGTIYGEVLPNAKRVAWLLTTYGTSGQGDQAKALQAAIWHVINPDRYALDISSYGDSSYVDDLYLRYLAESEGKEGTLSNFLWITPGRYDNGAIVNFQGLVTSAPVPEPISMLLFGTGLVAAGGYVRRRLKK